MAEFKREKIESFLGVVRKYMQMRGAMSQKDLAEVTDVGVSTMSRFLSQKSTEMNPQLIAKITAKLNIPLHEMIDFVEEDFSDRFVRLVKFYKDEITEEERDADPTKVKTEIPKVEVRPEANKEATTKEKLESLTARQKAFMTEFLNMKPEERDLIVDLGNNIFQYFKMKGMGL
jgi:transcriptional regulator with XRE-family HTH domain